MERETDGHTHTCADLYKTERENSFNWPINVNRHFTFPNQETGV